MRGGVEVQRVAYRISNQTIVRFSLNYQGLWGMSIMVASSFVELLKDWESRQLLRRQKVVRSVSLFDTDVVKIKALASIYNLSEQEVIASIIHHGLFELETRMPYEKGARVIRIEEGENIYEDAGMMPRYIDKIREITRGG
jgi:hypothetical protein